LRPRARRWAAVAAVLGVAVALAIVGAISAGSGRDIALASGASTAHPLDPLSTAEIDQAVGVIEADGRFPAGGSFPIVTLQEPTKAQVAAWSPGQSSFVRRAFANVYSPTTNRAIEVVVDLRTAKVVSWTPRSNVQPAVYLTEYDIGDEIVRADSRFKKAMRDRGLDPKDVYLDLWAPGDHPDPPVDPAARILRAIPFFRGELPNPYDRPIEGVIATVDMNKEQVVDFTDTGIVPVNTTITGNAPGEQPGLTDLVTRQPDGPSFRLDGRKLSWQSWQMRVGYNPREGLVLHQIGYEDKATVRPIIHRIGLDEIYVPYALPDKNWVWRSAFDVGEYNIGQYAESLRKNVDVPENAVFFEESVMSDTGSADGAYTIPRAVAIYERDAGSLWDRLDPTTFERDARFARELVVTGTNNIGNYTYQTEYVFRLDGSMAVNVGLTGTTLNQGVKTNAEGSTYGSMVAPNISAPSHQHFFNFRIDFDVDGTSNRMVEVDTMPMSHPFGNVFHMHHTPLNTEQSRDVNATASRFWMVESRTKLNAFGKPTAYMIKPGDTTVPYSSSSYVPLKRAAFAQHPLWVTRYKQEELYAAGDYPNQGRAGEGLTAYTKSPENVSNGDLVAWFTTGTTHHPSTEHYPVLRTHLIGFELHPMGFFDTNQALDAPVQRGE
jgi:primary-amine oxidase